MIQLLFMEPALRWSAYEHDHIERGSDWYWALGVVAISIAITAIILHDLLFGILVILAAITLGLLARTPPELAHFEISERGIRVNDILHRWDHIISFWVEDEHAARPQDFGILGAVTHGYANSRCHFRHGWCYF